MDEIATERNMSLIAVSKSIQRMEDWKYLNSEEEVNVAINSVFLKHIPGIDKALKGALGAKIVSHERVGKDKYRKMTRPDHAMQLKSIETFKALIESTRPKGGGVNIALQQNNATGGAVGADGRPSGNSFEERLRKIREAKGLKDEAEVIIDAEVIESSSVQDELSDIGIDLDDDEDEDDDDLDDIDEEDEEDDG